MGPLLIVAYLAVAALVCSWVIFKYKRRRLEMLGDKLPGPKPFPIVGNSLSFVGVKNAEDLWKICMGKLVEYKKEHGSIFRFWIGPILAVIVGDLDAICTLLASPHTSTKHWWYSRLMNFISQGTVFGSHGKEYQELKKSFMRYFPIKEIESYMQVYETKALQLMLKAEKKLGTGVFNIHDLVKFYFLDIVLITHLGAVDMNEMEENKYDFHHHLERVLEISFTRALKPQYQIDSLYYMTPMGKKHRELEIDVTSISRAVLQKRIDALKSRGIDLSSDFIEESYTDVIIKKGFRENLTLQEMAFGITDVVVGGSDTTALALAYTILCLAMHPEYQERAYQEQLDLFGESDRAPTFKEAQGMPYLTMCYKEALRLHAPIGIGRAVTGDVQVGDHIIPEGSVVYLLFYNIHRNPEYYCKPDEFYPEHFTTEACNSRPKMTFIPFSHGSRQCPGSLYSSTSVKTLLSLLIRKFRFSSPLRYKDLTFRFSLMLENLDGYPVEIHKRTKRESVWTPVVNQVLQPDRISR